MIKNPITCYLSANFMLKRSREFSISVESKKTDTFSKKHDTKQHLSEVSTGLNKHAVKSTANSNYTIKLNTNISVTMRKLHLLDYQLKRDETII